MEIQYQEYDDQGNWHQQRRRVAFPDLDCKTGYDARGVISRSEKDGKDPMDFKGRKDDYTSVLRTRIQLEQEAAMRESGEVDPRLSQFKAHYDRTPAMRTQIIWQDVQDRLLDNDCYYLGKALEMVEPVLFGVDKEGNPLIADGCEEPIMTGVDYMETRDRVYYQGKDDEKVPTGYELFPYSDEFDKSSEIIQFEINVGPFLRSAEGEYSASYLESGCNPKWPRTIFTTEKMRVPQVNAIHSLYGGHTKRGVRRLLRVKSGRYTIL